VFRIRSQGGAYLLFKSFVPVEIEYEVAEKNGRFMCGGKNIPLKSEDLIKNTISSLFP
jgi:hypothetical protein